MSSSEPVEDMQDTEAPEMKHLLVKDDSRTLCGIPNKELDMDAWQWLYAEEFEGAVDCVVCVALWEGGMR